MLQPPKIAHLQGGAGWRPKVIVPITSLAEDNLSRLERCQQRPEACAHDVVLPAEQPLGITLVQILLQAQAQCQYRQVMTYKMRAMEA